MLGVACLEAFNGLVDNHRFNEVNFTVTTPALAGRQDVVVIPVEGDVQTALAPLIFVNYGLYVKARCVG